MDGAERERVRGRREVPVSSPGWRIYLGLLVLLCVIVLQIIHATAAQRECYANGGRWDVEHRTRGRCEGPTS